MVDFSASYVRAPVVNAEDHLAVKPRRQDGPVKLLQLWGFTGKSVGFFWANKFEIFTTKTLMLGVSNVTIVLGFLLGSLIDLF